MGETPKLDPEGLRLAAEAIWEETKGYRNGLEVESFLDAAEAAVSAYLSSAGLSVSLTEEETRVMLAALEASAEIVGIPDEDVVAYAKGEGKLRAALASSGEEGNE